jgi:hypothetical protein
MKQKFQSLEMIDSLRQNSAVTFHLMDGRH